MAEDSSRFLITSERPLSRMLGKVCDADGLKMLRALRTNTGMHCLNLPGPSDGPKLSGMDVAWCPDNSLYAVGRDCLKD